MALPAKTVPGTHDPKQTNHEAMAKMQNMVISTVFFIVICATLFFAFRVVTGYISLQTKSSSLQNLLHYDQTLLQANDSLRQASIRWNTFADLGKSVAEKGGENTRYEKFFRDLQQPYDTFLQYRYLPRLHIWENPHTKVIDLSLIGKKFLDKNPYTDIALILKWSDFFRDVGDTTQFNEIKNIVINPIEEDVSGYYRIPIQLEFLSPSRRSFLLLVEKISSTANKENIVLINEFTYGLWQEILKTQSGEIAKDPTLQKGILASGGTVDDKLGYFLDTVLDEEGGFDLFSQRITTEMIQRVVAQTAGCKKVGAPECGFLFREKYRTVPFLAYSITSDGDIVRGLYDFFKNLPPLTQISQFSFDKAKSDGGQVGYEGTIGLHLYGKGISKEEIDVFAARLGKECFVDGTTLSLDTILQKIEQNIGSLGGITEVDGSKATQLQEIVQIITAMKETYEGSTNYRKMVTLLEARRTINDGGVCDR